MTLTHHGPGPKPYYRTDNIDWQALRADLLALHAQHPGTWLKVETAIINGDRYLNHRLRTNSALNDLSVNQFRRKAFPQKNGSQKIKGWEIWLRLDPASTALKEEQVSQDKAELIDLLKASLTRSNRRALTEGKTDE